ncbi:hypothetical protein THOM_2387 [Trachipleistophora hominis]|uniref:Uncharacterized protein n=1 Tax=Trachipleistophora hominis TaxID=72359 RepID=L7JTT0_TRAHO|nr:hypothetical protein THOM_2387 [Trachipleistophora hominis]
MHIGSYQPILHTVKTFFQHSSQEMDENRENNTLINDDGINTSADEGFVEVNTRSRADDNLYSTGNVAKMDELESAKHVISEKTGANRTKSTEKIPYVTDSSDRYDRLFLELTSKIISVNDYANSKNRNETTMNEVTRFSSMCKAFNSKFSAIHGLQISPRVM